MLKQINLEGLNGSYRMEGKGRPLVLIHGFCADGTMFDGITKRLAEKFTIIRPDLPGHGNALSNKLIYSMDWMASYIDDILQQEGIEKAVVMGHSMGGYIALAWAEKYPERCEGLGLINSHVFADSEEKKANRRKSIDFIRRNGSALFIKELFLNLFDETFKMAQMDKVEDFIRKGQQMQAESVIAAMEGMMERAEKGSMLEGSGKKLLLICGKRDNTIPMQQSIEQLRFMKAAMLELQDATGHMSVIEREAESAKAIIDYMHWIN
jgi:pimeloyl-ACP methyl ester carboxylesterase